MDEIAERARLQPDTAQNNAATITEDGTPNKRYAERESMDFGHLIPFKTTGSASIIAGGQKEASEQAVQLSSLPTAQLRQILSQQPNSPWGPYLRSIIQQRDGLTGRRGGRPVGAQPEGRMPGTRRSATPVPAGGLQSAAGFTGYSTPFAGLSDEQLLQLADDPKLLNRLNGQ